MGNSRDTILNEPDRSSLAVSPRNEEYTGHNKYDNDQGRSQARVPRSWRAARTARHPQSWWTQQPARGAAVRKRGSEARVAIRLRGPARDRTVQPAGGT